MNEIRVSEGTAAVLGLNQVRAITSPRTAYLMIGEGCPRDCAFCAQARGATGPAGHLSRVVWPSYPTALVIERLAVAAQAGALERICLQTVAGAASLAAVRSLIPLLTRAIGLPVSASVYLRDLDDLAQLFDLGLDRAGIAIDAASPEVYRRTKHGEQAPALGFLAAAAAAHPGRVSTHLIIGMGETEQEALTFIEWSLDRGITVGLFAFTPVRGTDMADVPPPPLAAYRRVQAAAELMRRGVARLSDLHFDGDGRLAAINLPRQTVEDALADGRAFETSGCIGCNRPYYNERPGHVPYNYPTRLSRAELAAAAEPILALVPGVGQAAGR